MIKKIGNYLIIIQYIDAFIMIISCSFITAGYGRYSTPRNWGIRIKAKTAWLIMESPNLVIPIVTFLYTKSNNQTTGVINLILLSLYIIHYIHRDIIYPVLMDKSNPNDMPIIVMLLAFLFCLVNSMTQTLSLLFIHNYSIEWLISYPFIIGLVLFIMGAAINIQSDYILLSMRLKAKEENKKSRSYFIPTGGMFHYVSCANYFGEIMEWLGFAIACMSPAAFSFFLCTVANLVPRALTHHKWYLEKFEDYPKDRKAVFPFLL